MSASDAAGAQQGGAQRACLSCRQRRQWCDRTLPNCINCTKAGRQCGGYDAAIRAFVNLDVTNASRPNKKQVLQEALASSKTFRVNEGRFVCRDPCADQVADPATLTASALSRLDIVTLQADFPSHFEALWRTFALSYCQTKDYWPLGCSVLALRNKALDYSLMALSAQRLALSYPESSLHILSLTAYDKSLGLYRELIQHNQNDSLNGILAVTSTVYAVLDACLTRPGIANFSWGSSGHFDGALALLEKSGPELYSTKGFHHVFKKIREMGLFLALSRREETFLATQEWIDTPWKSHPKTWRDKLYDLVLGLTGILSSNPESCPPSTRQEFINSLVNNVLQIEAGISQWQQSMVRKLCPHLQHKCECQYPAPLSCICSLPASQFPTNEFAMLQTESLAFQLHTGTALKQLVAFEYCAPVPWAAHLPDRCSHIANLLEAASTSSKLRQTSDQTPGLTEGFCRTIFSSWALNQYRQAESNDK